ncbi:MAG: TIGR03936 family radical SAM-associated protein [Omnitrophica bacterium]|nr:TIGR03936 family radical SAM-associated protein [Candidatus Omnitrophota bacterium]
MQNTRFLLKLGLYKSGEMIYFSQLDLIHILARALRRTNLPLYYTQGFNPRVKISFSSGLKLGTQGRVDTTFYFTEQISHEKLKTELQPQLPEGLEIIKDDVKC